MEVEEAVAMISGSGIWKEAKSCVWEEHVGWIGGMGYKLCLLMIFTDVGAILGANMRCKLCM